MPENEMSQPTGEIKLQEEQGVEESQSSKENLGGEQKIEAEGSKESSMVEVEELSQNEVLSILESLLFATDRPQGINLLHQAFKGTNITTPKLKEALELLKAEYAGKSRGLTLEEVGGGFQLRTKADNLPYLRRMIKTKSFKLSPPALEVLSIVAYKQPCIKAVVDEIRGVESGHLLRALMDRGIVTFMGKSDLPGKPMLYGTTKKFLEIFSLRNTRELPSLSEIDNLIPEGIGDVEDKEESLSNLTQNLPENLEESYSRGEDELGKITDKLGQIKTSLNLNLKAINEDAKKDAETSKEPDL